MTPSTPPSVRRDPAGRLRAGATVATLGGFAALTHVLFRRDLDFIDRLALLAVARKRRPWLGGVAVDVSALGSPVVLASSTAVASLLAIAFGRRRDALQLVTAATGAGVSSRVAKHAIARRRPAAVARLVVAAGSSYPSGHSLASSAIYLTRPLIVSRRHPAARPIAHAAGALTVAAIALSRIYLGVHFPSDVVGGVCLGAGWALVVDALCGRAAHGRQKLRRDARADARESTLEQAMIDTAVSGWRDNQLVALDAVHAELAREPDVRTAEAATLTSKLLTDAREVRSQIARAQPFERDDLIDRYAQVLRALNDAWRETA
jgi:membrane-associated phospholipid phosphatase